MPHFTSGLDLGQMSDYTALVVVEHSGYGEAQSLMVRHIHRWPLGTAYPRMVEQLVEMFASAMPGSTLIVDATGVGVAVVDIIRESGIPAGVEAYTITAGFKPGDGTVPKKDLVGAVQAALGQKRLKIPKSLPLADTLVKELEAFRVKVTADRNETFAAWRERDHDDLVLALALAAWSASKWRDPAEMEAVNAANAALDPFGHIFGRR